MKNRPRKTGESFQGYRGEGFREGIRDNAGDRVKNPYGERCPCGQHREYARGSKIVIPARQDE